MKAIMLILNSLEQALNEIDRLTTENNKLMEALKEKKK